MNRILIGMLGCAFAFVLGCGSDSSGSGSYSCDIKSGMSHGCTDYTYSGNAADTSALKSACTSAGGTAGDACDHTGSVGGCKMTATSGGSTSTVTSWYYAPITAAIAMQSCPAPGTFVTP